MSWPSEEEVSGAMCKVFSLNLLFLSGVNASYDTNKEN